jgi:polyisoprenoid-binding protein YceI
MTTATAPASTAVRSFNIDKTHSEIGFQVRHLLTKVRGRFTDFNGTIQFDQSNPERSSVAFAINASSIDTGVPDRDAHLRGDDFFAPDTFPTITFNSSRVTKTSAEQFAVEGTLTIRDTAKVVTLPVTYLGTAKDPWGNSRIGFESEITINRKDFGLNWNAALETGGFLVGDEVKISLSVQAIATNG